MEKVWKAFGHKSSKFEWDSANARINYNTVRRHFDGWTNACLKFIEYKTGGSVLTDDVVSQNRFSERSTIIIKEQEERREIPLKLRLKVLQRDNF
jgi:hypothetical protein